MRSKSQIRRGYVYLLMLPSFLLGGCAMRLFGFLTAEEMGLARLAGVRIGITGVAIENEAAFSSMIARTRLIRPLTGNPRLYIIQNGIRKEFAELTSSNTLRWLKSGNTVTLPGRLYTVRNNLVKATLRQGPGQGYAVYKPVHANQLLIVLEENNGWCRVKLDNSVTGWLAASTITAALPGTTDPVSNTNIIMKDSIRFEEVKFIDLGYWSVVISEIQRVLNDSTFVTRYSQETNQVPANAAARLNTGITIRCFDSFDIKKANRLKTMFQRNPIINRYSVYVENNWIQKGNTPIPGYLEIWLK